MRTHRALLSAVALIGLGWSANHVFSQDMGGEKKTEAPPAAGPTPEEIRAWTESMTPGEPHTRLEAQSGVYVVKGRTWMDSKTPPAEFQGTSTFRMILGGRYQVQEFTGDSAGRPFEGTGLAGYDNVAKEHFSTWVDNVRTGIVCFRGKADEQGVVTLTGEMDDPMHPGVRCRFRQVMKFADKDHFSFETWRKDEKHPEEFKAIEMSYTRRR